MSDLFVDRLGNVTIASGVARLDFLRLVSLDTEKQQARMEPGLRLVLPLDGLVQTIEMLEKIKVELAKSQSARPAFAASPPLA